MDWVGHFPINSKPKHRSSCRDPCSPLRLAAWHDRQAFGFAFQMWRRTAKRVDIGKADALSFEFAWPWLGSKAWAGFAATAIATDLASTKCQRLDVGAELCRHQEATEFWRCGRLRKDGQCAGAETKQIDEQSPDHDVREHKGHRDWITAGDAWQADGLERKRLPVSNILSAVPTLQTPTN